MPGSDCIGGVVRCIAYLVWVGLLFIAPTPRHSQTVPKVHFAGFGFAGDAKKNQTAYPYSIRLQSLAGSPVQTADGYLGEQLNKQRYQALNITGALGDYKKGDGLALAFVVTWENVSKEHYNDFTKIAVNLQAEALLFDYSSQQIVAAYPFGSEYIDAVHGDVDDSQILADVGHAYLDPKSGLFDQFIAGMARVQPKQTFGGRIQVVSVDVSKAAADTLEASGVDPDSARNVLAGSFERYLSYNDNVPVLPYSNDQVIGGQMKLQFENGDIFNLKIPACDYRITLSLDSARKIIVGQTSSQIATAYASYVTLKIDQPLSGTVYLDDSVKWPVVKIVSTTGVAEDSSSFYESIMSISDEITKQLFKPSKEWASKWITREAQAGQMIQIAALLDRCR
jgi:hypothetical protein